MANPTEIAHVPQTMSSFLVENAQTIHESLQGFKENLREHGANEQTKPLLAIEDPHSLPGTRRALHSVSDETLDRYGIQRSGGFIILRKPEGEQPWDIYSYFSDKDTGEFIIDVTPGVLAEAMGTTLDAWIAAFPGLFYERILICDKLTIANRLGVIFPRKNRTFDEHWRLEPQFLEDEAMASIK